MELKNQLRSFLATVFILASPIASSTECVILLHGLARTSNAMTTLESVLSTNGFTVANVDYPSRHKPIEELAPLAISKGLKNCGASQSTKVHFITHSMGGILVRYYLENHRIENLGHVVMLAPPNQGSEIVDNLSNVPGFALVNGPAGLQLGTGPNSVPSRLGPVNYSVGIIAGSRTFNPILSQFLPNPDDGKVSMESTKVSGMQDFVVVDASHPFIMKDKVAIDYAIRFIEKGSFNENSP
jgi:pimeloyl-ACP methyl ester carboxylesterase